MVNDQTNEFKNNENQWRGIYRLGGVASSIALVGILLDVIVGSVTGGSLSALPQTAIDRFAQLQDNALLGLYNLDLLNTIIQIIMIPVYFALYSVHRIINGAYASLALITFLAGSIIFVTANTALPMFELSNKYAAATSEAQRFLFASAGEAMLARGEHGGLGVFIGFFIVSVAGIIMSFVMLQGKIFNSTTSYLGIAGNFLLMTYLVLVTFVSGAGNMAIAIAMPGGLMAIAWTILFTNKLFQLSNRADGFNTTQYQSTK